jgi:RalA-binding protein 1
VPQYQAQSQVTQAQSRASTSSFQDPPRRTRAMSKDEILKGNALPISQLAPDASNAKLFQAAPPPPELGSTGGLRTSAPFPIDNSSKQLMDPGQASQDVPLSSSLPSHLDVAMGSMNGIVAGAGQPGQRSNSELGHYPDMVPPRKSNRASYHPSATQAQHQQAQHPGYYEHQRPASPDKVKISGPINGAPIPAGHRFGGKDLDAAGAPAGNDRERKAKSGRFWGFGRTGEDTNLLTPRNTLCTN